VRELENFVRRLVVLGDTRRAIDELRARVQAPRPATTLLRAPRLALNAESVELPVVGGRAVDPYGVEAPAAGEIEGFDLKAIARRAARDAERKALIEVLEHVRWNRAAAARVLKVSYKTLLTKIIECGIESRRVRPTR
jgi:DNA-binding NtrC family response regulator